MENLDALTNNINNISLNKDESFLYRNLECRDFVTLETRANHGQVVVATRDAAVGTRIIREDPILVYEVGNMEEMVSKFLALDRESRDAILNMHHPPVPSPDILVLGFFIANELSLDPTVVHKLIAIDKYNSRKYHGSEQEIYFHVQSALFLIVSKLAHSCNPNTVLAIDASGGRIEYRVMRPIKAGDMITYAVFGQLVELPHHRKQNILQEMEIVCQCPHCIGPDYSRPVHCKKCRGGVLICTNSPGDDPSWSCSGCNGVQNVERRIKTLETEAEENLVLFQLSKEIDTDICSASNVKDKINEIGRKLHPQHYVALNLMQLYIDLCTSDATAIEILSMLGMHPFVTALFQREKESPDELRRKAIQMGVSLVEKLECIAAGCICSPSTARHMLGRYNENAPVPFASKNALHIAKLMMKIPPSTWRKNECRVVHRYLPMLKVMCSKEGLDFLHDIERKIPSPPNVESEALTTVNPSFPVAAKMKAKQRRKRGGRTNKKRKGRKR